MGVGMGTFERCRKFYELLYSKTAAELLSNMRNFQRAFRPTKLQVKAVGFGELQAILILALGIEHPSSKSAASSSASTTATTAGSVSTSAAAVSNGSSSGDKIGLVHPNAGTLGLHEVSRQKLNEYLIELHEIAGEHDSSDDDDDDNH